MRNFKLALAAAGCLAFSMPPALATVAMSSTGPSSDVSAKSGLINQKLAQTQNNSRKRRTRATRRIKRSANPGAVAGNQIRW